MFVSRLTVGSQCNTDLANVGDNFYDKTESNRNVYYDVMAVKRVATAAERRRNSHRVAVAAAETEEK